MMLTLISARNNTQAETVTNMATIIWREHYSPIIGDQQVAYMLATIQSKERILADFVNVDYYIIQLEHKAIGYLALETKRESFFLSKIYLYKEVRGRGYGHSIISYLKNKTRLEGKKYLELTVNKYNPSAILFYEKIGFQRVDAIISDIGKGFFMDDYVYRLYV